MTIKCVHCNEPVHIPISESRYIRWRDSIPQNYIQDEFPDLSASQREMFLSGICENCWSIIFPEEDEDL